MNIRHAVTGAVLILALAGCGASTVTQTSTATATPTSSATASSSATSSSAVAGCAFSATIVSGQGSYAGHTVDTVMLTNTGSGSCTLNGFPTVQLKDASGNPVSSPTEADAGGQAATATPAPVAVAPGGTANFVLEFSDVGSGSAPCASVSGASMTLPGWNGTLTLNFGSSLMPCPPQFNVGAVTS